MMILILRRRRRCRRRPAIRFTCKWCDLAGTECLVLTKPPKFEAMVDAFLNLMWEKRRKEYKVRV